MENDYSKHAEGKFKDVAGDAERYLKQGQEQVTHVFETMDKQVRENPWPIIVGAVIGGMVVGCLLGRR